MLPYIMVKVLINFFWSPYNAAQQLLKLAARSFCDAFKYRESKEGDDYDNDDDANVG